MTKFLFTSKQEEKLYQYFKKNYWVDLSCPGFDPGQKMS